MHEMKAKATQAAQTDIFLMLAALGAMSYYYYGFRPLVLCALGALVCFGADTGFMRLCGKKRDHGDYSAAITGLLLALMMPASVPYYILIVSCLVGIIIGKQAFGGKDHQIFNPAAVGYVFAAMSWKAGMLLYPEPYTKPELTGTLSHGLTNSFSYIFNTKGASAPIDIDVLLNNPAGPIGATQIIAVSACAIVLIMRRSVSILTFSGFLGTYCFISYLFPSIPTDAGRLTSVGYELMTNMLLFGGIFIASDLRSVPTGFAERIIYGILLGGLTLIFRRVGDVENGVVYASLLASPLSALMEDYYNRSREALLRGLHFIADRVTALFRKITRKDESGA